MGLADDLLQGILDAGAGVITGIGDPYFQTCIKIAVVGLFILFVDLQIWAIEFVVLGLTVIAAGIDSFGQIAVVVIFVGGQIEIVYIQIALLTGAAFLLVIAVFGNGALFIRLLGEVAGGIVVPQVDISERIGASFL